MRPPSKICSMVTSWVTSYPFSSESCSDGKLFNSQRRLSSFTAVLLHSPSFSTNTWRERGHQDAIPRVILCLLGMIWTNLGWRSGLSMSFISLVRHKQTTYFIHILIIVSVGIAQLGSAILGEWFWLIYIVVLVLNTYCDGLLDILFPDSYIYDLQTMEPTFAYVAWPVVCRRWRGTKRRGFK